MPLLTKTQKRRMLSLLPDFRVQAISQRYNEPATLRCNGREIRAACLRCRNPKCIRYSEEEICCSQFPEFSYERDTSVCPVGAIRWSYDRELPEIDPAKCIGCGLCAARCPMGAIYKSGGQLRIAPPSRPYEDVPCNWGNENKQALFLRELEKLSWKRQFQRESDAVMEQLYREAARFDGRSMAPGLLVRNLMIALEHPCALSRTGDVYTRMDGIYFSKRNPSCRGVVEIEFGRDTLEASRGILDDIAVMHARDQLNKTENAALVVCLALPNKRQGYFQVIRDIRQVLDLKIQTITLGALLTLLWNGSKVSFQAREFYADFDHMGIRRMTEAALGRAANLGEGMLGILEPEK